MVNYAGDYVLFNEVTYEWLNAFILFKRNAGTPLAGIMSYLATMRAVYKEAQWRKSLEVPPENPFLNVIKKVTPKPPVDFTQNHIKKLYEFTPVLGTTKINVAKMQRNIDAWLFQFFIGGHDYADIARMRWENIRDGRIIFKRYKNRNKLLGGLEANNILLPEALDIIKKHGTPDHDRIFSFIPDPETETAKYKEFRNNVNRSLKSICNSLKIPVVKSKTPRYVFRTFAGEKLIHDILVARIMAHKLEGVTYRYQGVISQEVQDNAHKSIAGR